MIMRGLMWLIRASWVLWLLTIPAEASDLGDLVKSGDVAAVAAALDRGAEIDEIDEVSALYIAVENGNLELVRLLIARGADVSLRVSGKRTPLYAASKFRYADIIKLLLDNGADPNESVRSETALHLAAQGGCLQCVIHLVKAGADVNSLSRSGSPPIHLAKLVGHDDVVAYLKSHGARSPPIAPISARLASANAESGKLVFQKACARCHIAKSGAKDPERPNLWDIVGRGKALEGDFQYSPVLRDAGGTWTFEELNSYILNPGLTLPGTYMGFAGLTDEKQRADLIAYLQTLSDTPVPLPEN